MGIEVTDFRTHTKNTLRGFLTVRLTSVGLEIRDIALHQKNGRQWLQLPAKPYTKPDGSRGWSYILAFYEKDRFRQFQEVTLRALNGFRGQARRNHHGETS